MTAEPHMGDALIRDAAPLHPGEFFVVDAITRRPLQGPFPSLRAALVAAQQIAGDRVWRENVDEHGRALGPPFRLTFPSHGS